MKLRYYLRGLGIGMLVTAMILIFGTDNKVSLSDEEIKARAAQLGMVESSSLTLVQMQNMQEATNEEIPTQSQESQAGTGESGSENSGVGGGENSGADENQSQESQAGTDESGSENPGVGGTENSGADEGQSQESQMGTGEGVSDGNVNAGESQFQDTQQVPTVGVQTSAPMVENGVEIIEITIPGGSSSGAVSRQLENAGLVENALEFDNYLCNNGYSRRIRVGTFKIPVGSEWQEIADIISTR